MTSSESVDRVAAIVCSVLQIDAQDPETLTRAGLSEWDSLSHVEIMFSVEEEFSVMFDPAVLQHLDSVDAIAAQLAKTSP